jgi:23S rRNA pseudouridine1911/1915/1917 synthase
VEKKLSYQVEKDREDRTVKQILQQDMGLTARQISRAKFLPDGILVTREGKTDRVTVRFLLQEGDLLSVKLEEKERASSQLVPLAGTPDIRYEDEDLLLISKPAGQVVHPSPGHYGDSLANLLAGYYQGRGEGLVVRPVGRLDKDTSGLLLFAKNAAAAYRLEKEREKGEMGRYYLALAEGFFETRAGTVEAPLGPAPGERMKRQVRADGAWARTDYRVIRDWQGADGGYSLLLVKLHTGRTHQIRVHLAYLGHPLLGDPLYGTPGKAGMQRTALHACRIRWKQPFTGQPMDVWEPLPEDMERLCPGADAALYSLQSRDL